VGKGYELTKIRRKYIENRGQKWGCFNGTYLRNR